MGDRMKATRRRIAIISIVVIIIMVAPTVYFVSQHYGPVRATAINNEFAGYTVSWNFTKNSSTNQQISKIVSISSTAYVKGHGNTTISLQASDYGFGNPTGSAMIGILLAINGSISYGVHVPSLSISTRISTPGGSTQITGEDWDTDYAINVTRTAWENSATLPLLNENKTVLGGVFHFNVSIFENIYYYYFSKNSVNSFAFNYSLNGFSRPVYAEYVFTILPSGMYGP